MTSHSSHIVTAVALPPLFTPAEIAEALGCSEWWVKEQARQRRIPFTRPGGAYRFTAEHFEQIIRLFEKRPTRCPEVPDVAPARRSGGRGAAEPPARLVARPPRRSRQAQPSITAA